MLDPTQDNQEGNAQDQAQARRPDAPGGLWLLGQRLAATALVLGLLAYSVDNMIEAFPEHNTPELGFAIPTTLVLSWFMYKIVNRWASWRTLPSAAELESTKQARRRGHITGQRVFVVWFAAVVWVAYAASGWLAYPNRPASQHFLPMLLAVVFLTLAVLLTLGRRRQLSATNGARR